MNYKKLLAVYLFALFYFLILLLPVNATEVLTNQSNGSKTTYLFRTESLASTTEEAASLYIEQNKDNLGLGINDDLELVKKVTNDIGITFHYRQTYKGIPVYNSDFVLSVSPEGEVFYTSELLKKGLDEKLIGRTFTPVSSKDQLVECVKKDLRVEDNKTINASEPELNIYYENETFKLVWLTKTTSPSRLYVVNDGNCQIIYAINLTSHATGTGFAYEQNPTITPNFTPVTLTDLIGNGMLQGTFFDLVALLPSGDVFLTSEPPSSNSFNYTPDQDAGLAFTFVNVYYHLTKAKDYFESNFNFRQDVKLMVFLTGDENAYYDEGKSELVLGQFINQGLDFALDGETIAHEYGHYVQDLQNNTSVSIPGSEARGIGEGVSDYFATSIYGDDCLGEYLAPVAASILGGMCLRDLDNNNTYPTDIFLDDKAKKAASTNRNTIFESEEHVIGETWGAFLADLRKELGKNVSDKIVFNSLALLPQSAFLSTGLATLIQADQELNGGANAEKIREVAGKRGIYEKLAVMYSPGSYDTPQGIIRHTSRFTGEQTVFPLVFFKGREHELFFQSIATTQALGIQGGIFSPDLLATPATVVSSFQQFTIRPILLFGEGGLSFNVLPIQTGGFFVPMQITDEFPIGEYLFGINTVSVKRKSKIKINPVYDPAKIIPFGATINGKHNLVINSDSSNVIIGMVNSGSTFDVSIDPLPDAPIAFTVEPIHAHPGIEVTPTTITLSKENPTAKLQTKTLKVNKGIIKRDGKTASYSIHNDGKGGYILKSVVITLKGSGKK